MMQLARITAVCVVVIFLTEDAFARRPGRHQRRHRREYREPRNDASDVSTITLKLGLPFAGTGSDRDFANGDEVDVFDYSEELAFPTISADFLYNVPLSYGSQFRVGLGLSLLPRLEIDLDQVRDDFTLGTELDVSLVSELFLPLNPVAGIFGRAFIGPSLLFAGGDLADLIETRQNDPDFDADVADGPFVGITGGLGMGASFRVSPSVGFRAELVWQGYHLPYYEADFGRDEDTSSVTGGRFLLMAGVEF